MKTKLLILVSLLVVSSAIAVWALNWPGMGQVVKAQTADKTQASGGEEITYTIAYTNSGSGGATDTVITDSIPTGATYITGSASNGGTLGGTTLTWNIGAVVASASGSVSFKVKVD